MMNSTNPWDLKRETRYTLHYSPLCYKILEVKCTIDHSHEIKKYLEELLGCDVRVVRQSILKTNIFLVKEKDALPAIEKIYEHTDKFINDDKIKDVTFFTGHRTAKSLELKPSK